MPDLANIHTFWHGEELGLWEKICLTSFLSLGHNVTVFSYNDKLDLPAGMRLADAREILSEDKIFFYKHEGKGSIAGFADLFRYQLLLKRGGCWVDADMIALKPILESGKLQIGREDGRSVNIALISTPPEHPMMREAFEKADTLGANARWGQGGPQLVTSLIKKYEDSVTIMAPEKYYPVHWHDCVSLFLLPEKYEACKAACKNADAVHLYNEIFRRLLIPKSMMPPAGSFLHEIFTKSPIETGDIPVMEADMVRCLIKGSDNYIHIRRNKFLRAVQHGFHRFKAATSR